MKDQKNPETPEICIILSKEHLALSEMEAISVVKKRLRGSGFRVERNLLFAKIPETSLKQTRSFVKTMDRLAYSKVCFLAMKKIKQKELQNEFQKEQKKELKKATEPCKAIKAGKVGKAEKTGFKQTTNPSYTDYLNYINHNYKNRRLFKKQLSFRISAHQLKIMPQKEKEIVESLASYVNESFGPFNVNLSSPDYDFIVTASEKESEFYFGPKLWETTEKFESRSADKRPAPHPTSMKPRLARAIVNLACPKKELLDPFCGSGGILIEAGIMGLKVKGIDIDRIMIERSRINLKHYGIKDYSLKIGDCLREPVKSECIVTDVPYGKSSRLKGTLKALVKEFLEKYSGLTETLVLICPDYLNAEKIARSAGWTLIYKTSIYVHGSLTREILVLDS